MPESLPSLAVALVGAHALVSAVLLVLTAHRILSMSRTRGIATSFDVRPPAVATATAGPMPSVLVQLPLYDERHVAERAIDALLRLDWPKDALRIQILDDSTDDTRAIVDRVVERARASGAAPAIRVLRRTTRAGFKAGALAAGLDVDAMGSAPAELVAIFDADFVPAPDFLQRVVPEFADGSVGMVQARWGHFDRDASVLARAQATLLDAHFAVEHAGRHRAGLWWNFNGTAGVWRRRAIEDAGGWEHDTLTEDLDLSFRAQLAGWRFVFRPDVVVPAELPASHAAFLVQQRRWARGAGQVLRKLSGRLLRARVPLRTRVEAWMSLAANGGYLALLAYVALLPPVVWVLATREGGGTASSWYGALAIPVGFAVGAAFLDRGQVLVGRSLRTRLLDVPLGLLASLALVGCRARAFVQGLVRGVGTFERTPKSGDASRGTYRVALPAWPWIETVASAWLLLGALHAFGVGAVATAIAELLLAVGFASAIPPAVAERRREVASRPTVPESHARAPARARAARPHASPFDLGRPAR